MDRGGVADFIEVRPEWRVRNLARMGGNPASILTCAGARAQAKGTESSRSVVAKGPVIRSVMRKSMTVYLQQNDHVIGRVVDHEYRSEAAQTTFSLAEI